MRNARQLTLFPTPDLQHGGQTRIGKRKIARPIDPKRPLHLVFRSSRARGAWSLLHPKNVKKVREIVDWTARKHGIRVYRFVNVGNHLHLMVLTKSRSDFRSFVREASGALVMRITGARKTDPLTGRFWDFAPYTRVVSWGRDFKNLNLYFIKNIFEATGLLTRRMKEAGVRPIPLEGWARPG